MIINDSLMSHNTSRENILTEARLFIYPHLQWRE